MDDQFLTTNTLKIEDSDLAMYEWLDQELNVFCQTKDGFNKVPVLWVTPERAFQVKNNKELRDYNGTLNYPLITIERSSIVKDEKNNGILFAALPQSIDRIYIGQRINQLKTSEFANADYAKLSDGFTFVSPKRRNEKIVYKFYTKKTPVYVNFTYSISLLTQYQQQMNEMLQPFITKTGRNRYFVLKKESGLYECFIDSNFTVKNSVSNLDVEERTYSTTINIKVLAILSSLDSNDNDSFIKEYENAVEIKFNKEEDMVKGKGKDVSIEIKKLAEVL